MTFSKLFRLIVFINCLSTATIQAEETDQFTLPPTELIDIGPEISSRLYDQLDHIRCQINAEIQRLKPQARWNPFAAKNLAQRLKGDLFADRVYQKTGPGFPRWLRNFPLNTRQKPLQYKEYRPWKTVYWLVLSQSPLSLIGLTPTINLYGVYFGTDKLGHFFMQGHSYYKLYSYVLLLGKTVSQAHAAIVRYGQIIEQTYLGSLVNGVYSNADLSANYAGWKFYTNLVQSVKTGQQELGPIFILEDDKWVFSTRVKRETLLKPYLSDNLNEALNPSHYLFMRGQIQRQVKKRCPDWIRRRGITAESVQSKLKQTSRWQGEVYGHWLPKSRAVTLASCF